MINENKILRNIPQVNELLNENEILKLSETIPHDLIVLCIREVLNDIRADVLNNIYNAINKDDIINNIIQKINKKNNNPLKKVINATGVVLHTNFGRAILSKKAINSMINVSNNFSNLEYDLKKGVRGDRQNHIEKIITDILGCESAMVVNNNASATMLVLASIARNKEVIISRGELIEIGGSFRIPDVINESGTILKEVGTTNKTKLNDYLSAYNVDLTGALLKVHTSNYKIVGFTEEVELKDLVKLGNELSLPVIYDMGNGLMVDLQKYGIYEPTVKKVLNDGADIVFFSGDKLLGGPQAGIIVGKEKYISKMKKHPLARAFRVDKFTISALYETLYEYYDEKNAIKNIPILKMITCKENELNEKAKKLYQLLINTELKNNANIMIENIKEQIGGGTAPDVLLNGIAISIKFNDIPSEKVEREFRNFDIPIIARQSNDKILISLRTIDDDDIEIIVNQLKGLKI